METVTTAHLQKTPLTSEVAEVLYPSKIQSESIHGLTKNSVPGPDILRALLTHGEYREEQ